MYSNWLLPLLSIIHNMSSRRNAINVLVLIAESYEACATSYRGINFYYVRRYLVNNLVPMHVCSYATMTIDYAVKIDNKLRQNKNRS